MQFGVFDHLDLGAVPLGEHYENRLKLIEAYDRAGFRTYHLAEHHATPLGMAPSPSVFLAAVAQRTRRLRFGPLVYTLSLHHPLRVARGDLHARPDERRPARARRRPRGLAARGRATTASIPPRRRRCTSRRCRSSSARSPPRR